MSLSGEVRAWRTDKGYGFIKTREGDDLFVHLNEIPNDRECLFIGEKVYFDIRYDKHHGKDKATNVTGNESGVVIFSLSHTLIYPNLSHSKNLKSHHISNMTNIPFSSQIFHFHNMSKISSLTFTH